MRRLCGVEDCLNPAEPKKRRCAEHRPRRPRVRDEQTGMAVCYFAGCGNAAESGKKYCSGHRKQQQRTGSMRPLVAAKGGVAGPMDPLKRLKYAALGLADADSDADYERRERGLTAAACGYAAHILNIRASDAYRVAKGP